MSEATIKVTLNRKDALVVAYGPFEYAVACMKGDIPTGEQGGSAMQVRYEIARALGLEVKTA